VESGGQGEGLFDDATARQQHEAVFGHGVLDDLQPDACWLAAWAAVSPV
jgi:hypothetical protein